MKSVKLILCEMVLTVEANYEQLARLISLEQFLKEQGVGSFLRLLEVADVVPKDDDANPYLANELRHQAREQPLI